ncbi:MAG TPA: sigma 54-interacting transcriptional regulator [Acidobacteriota bacterium]|nr:sigma 54-interacting transcriptional regulator [Acidobacteriota bacterium]HNG93012.1 sigma 54-interacting transcriptional regulator [Acidobacteriota bacterium]
MSKPLFVRPLTVEERYQLEISVDADNHELQRRAQAILDSADGKTAHDIASQLKTSAENVKRWLRQFNTGGLEGIQIRKRGPEPRFTEAQIEAIRALAARSPLILGYPFEHWSSQKLAEAARQQGIVDNISHVTIQKILTDLPNYRQSATASSLPARNGTTATPRTTSPQVNGSVRSRITQLESRLRRGHLLPVDEAAVRCALSEAFENIGGYAETLTAVEHYDHAQPPDLSNDLLWQAHTRLRLGWGYTWHGNQPRALARMNEALRLFLDGGCLDGVGAAHYAIGRTYAEINEFKIGRDRIWQGLRLLMKQIETGAEYKSWNPEWVEDTVSTWRTRLMARMHLSLGVIDYCEGNFDAAKKNYVRALELATSAAHDRNLLGLVAMNLALIHDQVGERRDAKKYYEQAIEDFTKGGHEGFLARCHNNLGESLMHHGLWVQAAQHLEKALDLAERHQVRENEALTLITLAELRLLQGQIAVAEHHLSRAVQMLIDGDKWAEAYAQRIFGKILLAQGKEIDGLGKLQLALQMTTDIGDQYGQCLSYLELSDYYLHHEKLDQSESSLEMARELLQSNSGFYAAGVAQRITGKLEAARHRYPEAQQHLLQSISIFTANDDQYEVGVSRLEVGRLFQELQDFPQAHLHFDQAETLFVQLGAETAIGRVRELRQKLVTTPRATVTPANVAIPPSESLLLQRLIEACNARELLLQELAAILQENFAAQQVVVWERDEYGAVRVLLAHHTSIDPVRLVQRGEDLLAQGRRGSDRTGDESATPEWARLIFERELVRIGLYVSCDPAGIKMPFKYLQPLLKQVWLGLEISALRSARASVAAPAPPLPLQHPTSLIPGFIFCSPAMCEVVDHIRKIRTSDVTVLITGESGTGKELIARAVHGGSARRDAVFLPFNCTATPRDLIESQLFGHRRGAFTGAVSNYSGIIRAASGGTLFLDEIGDLTLETQPKLMRFLQEGEIQPLGETKPLKVDVRVLAATNVDLERAVKEGRFREDLYHRLNIIRIHVPPLRERRDEIPVLANHYLDHFSKRDGKKDLRFSQEAIELINAYDWSGNVRQLRNEIERIVAFAVAGTVIGVRELSPDISRQRSHFAALSTPMSSLERQSPPTFFPQHNTPMPTYSSSNGNDGYATISYPARATLREATERLELQMMTQALERTGHNISRAARELGLSRRGLRLKMEQLGLGAGMKNEE